MVERKTGVEIGHDEQVRRHMQVLYATQTREKQIFLDDLKEFRKRKNNQMINSIIHAVGPKWYQVLSVKQREALDTLEPSIYQDLLEGRPIRSAVILHNLGLIPCPQYTELMPCVSSGRNDPKEMLAELYFATYGYPINGKRISYCLNARLLLSAILYLGLDDLIHLLEKTFAPVATPQPDRKPKPKPQAKPPSPYLEKMVAVMYEPRRARRKSPLPLPDLSELNEPYEEMPIMQKPPPPPPPPPPPKKRIPIPYCEQLAGINTIKAHVSSTDIEKLKKFLRPKGKLRSKTKINLEGVTKKKYGIGIGSTQQKQKRRKKPEAPMTGLWNYQYTINGIFQVRGKICYVLGNITVLPARGELIHGGYTSVNGQTINIHCGYRGTLAELTPLKCDCVKQWQDAVFRYVRNTKCKCGHHYDFGNDEGHFSQEELPYFTKPSRHAPLKFHYDTIYDLDSQRQYIQKKFKKVWETESLLREDGGADMDQNKNKKAEKDSKNDGDKVFQADKNRTGDEKKKAVKGSKKGGDNVIQADNVASKVKHNETSQTCLGMRPKVTDYLKCALQLMRKVNVAARLPDLHLVPELKEWMRQRLYGKIKHCEKKEYLYKSSTYWNMMFTALADRGYGHVSPPKEPLYGRPTTWACKQFLNDSFAPYTERYKLSLFKSHAYVTNLLWRTMYQPEFPDKKFREIYFSYLYSRVDDIKLIHPYCKIETMERKNILMNKRYICLPAGYEAKI